VHSTILYNVPSACTPASSYCRWTRECTLVQYRRLQALSLCEQATLDDLGKGLGPALVAVLISWTDARTAFNVAVCGWVPSGLLMILSGLSAAKDELAMSARLAHHVENVQGDGLDVVQLAVLDDC
jgi:hypothetical protein